MRYGARLKMKLLMMIGVVIIIKNKRRCDMENRTLKIAIQVSGPYCTCKGKRCSRLKEGYLGSQTCQVFGQTLTLDKVTKEYKRLDKCLDSEV